MSAGSNNIVVQVTDQVDATIAPKIKAIGDAARNANTNINALQTSIATLGGGTANLNRALSALTPNLNTAGAGTGRLTGAIAQLAGRVAGAEAGFGMLGGAFARVGVAAGIAGPLIVAALAVAAVVGAILVYEKFEAAARKLVEAQATLYEHIGTQRDRLLTLHETLVGLVDGPLAKYRAELADLSARSIITDISAITKVLDEQKSKWATLVAFVERYYEVTTGLTRSTQKPFTIQDAEDFINVTKRAEAAASSQGHGLKGLQDALSATGAKLTELHNLEQTLNGRNLANTEVARKGVQDYYNALLQDLDIFNAERIIKVKGANGELLSEQRRASQEELRVFNDQLSKLKSDPSGVVSPQDTLALRQSQQKQFLTEHPNASNPSSPFNQTLVSLDKDVGNAQQAIARQNASLDDLITKYKNETLASGAYSVALKTEVEQRKAALDVDKIKPGGDAKTTEALNKLIEARQANVEISREETSIYQQFIGPIEKYNAAVAASAKLLKDGAISANQAAIADAEAARAKQDALNPLNEYVIGLQHEIALFNVYGDALAVATEVDKIRQDLQRQGRDLTVQETKALSDFLTKLQQQREIQSDINALYQENAGTIQRLLTQQLALNTAVSRGVITDTQYKLATAQVNIALADQALLTGRNATLQNQFVAGIGKYITSFKGLAKGISDSYGQAFQTIADGAANSLGRAIAFGENLGDALKNVARTAVSELISGFIKLGIQWLVNEAIAKTVGTAAVASSVAQAGATAAAWAPAAAFASLATFGANAAPADAALVSTVGIAEALSVLGKFAGGGLVAGPGNGTSDRILARLSNGEYVVNAQATSQNRDLLDAINSGSSAVRVNSSVGVGKGAAPLQIVVQHDGSTRIQVQRMSDDRIRVIAKQEAEQAVNVHAPKVIASDLQNPNSRTSKALSQNVETKRRR